MTDWPLISLVTPSFNQGRYLEATIRSVFAQEYPRLEYIVIDGGSSDESLEIIRRYADRLTYWVSEADSGQADAIVKGFSRASGVLMNWLNSDDLLRPGALHAVARAFLDGEPDFIVGRDRHFRTDPEHPESVFRPAGYRFPDCLRPGQTTFRHHQPCTFFSRAAYVRAGGLDPALHYVMDFDLYCRMLARPGCSVTYLEQELSAFRLHDAAKTSTEKAKFIEETRRVCARYWPIDWGDAERRALDRWSAECLVYQCAEAVRARRWWHGAVAFKQAIAYQPGRVLDILVAKSGETLRNKWRRIVEHRL